MEWIDIGVNLTDAAFDKDRDEVLERAWAANITQMVLTATSIESCAQVQALCATQPDRLFCTAGTHPHEARHWSSSMAADLRHLAGSEHVRALGECGLDFNRDFSPRPQQIKALEDQLALAVELGLPVFLHERDAAPDIVRCSRITVTISAPPSFTASPQTGIVFIATWTWICTSVLLAGSATNAVEPICYR